MSLFKSRDWWNTKCGIDETFGAFHMCIASYESTVNGIVKQIVIVGSLEGYLRLYDPKPPSSPETSCLSDLQLETQLALPILAVLSGRFNNTEGLHVAVLHPMHLRILRIVINENTELNSHCTVDFMYEHRLPLHGYALIAGPSNVLCVQSLTEGILMFFENERVGVSCSLPTLHLLPSPICYVSSTESFIVIDSSWNLQCYSYQSLANSTMEQQSSRTPGTSNKLLYDWEFELSEPAIDVQNLGSYIVILGERHLYCLKDSDGTMIWVRKLDYHPMCFTLLTPCS
ncbi:hypothetical protein GHT06_012680 [Daphnia sinensis]|uniref:PTHB1 N-terminal domain-containing protein n=1 Tax=Daphnia sinensis TaxID=1820382 RepID=A0AAD5Q001_9CRUS|nr:hypothetical protein GHT06_012680 [Daphnia sinensis]